MRLYYIYWYHLPEHTDRAKEGYIGITSNLKNRHYHHSTGRTNKHLTNAFNKYSNIIRDVIFQGTKDECLALEITLRPINGIGWNIIAGGGLPPSGMSVGKREGVALKNIQLGGLKKRGTLSPFKGQTSRHSQSTKDLIGSYHKGKIISNSHKQAITDKLSGGKSVRAHTVILINKNTNEEKSFDCVVEAAKFIGISRSAMKSRIRNDFYYPIKGTSRRKDGWFVKSVVKGGDVVTPRP